MSDFPRPEGIKPYETKQGLLAKNLSGIAVLLSLLAWLSSAFGMSSSWLPSFNRSWPITAGLSLISVAIALAGSRLAERVVHRVVACFGIGLSLISLSIPVTYYQATYHDYFFPALVPIVTLIPIGCWFCRLRLVAVGLVAFTVFWFYAAFMSPTTSSHRVVKAGELTMTIYRAEDEAPWNGESLSMDIEGPPDELLSNKWNFDKVEIVGKIGAWIPVTCWPPSDITEMEDTKPPLNVKHLNFLAFVPSWTRSWDATVIVPAVPTDKQPAKALVFRFPRLAGRD